VLRGTRQPFLRGADITVPVVCAYGDDDRIIPPRNRVRALLPPQADWVTLPGCGHVSMWDDSELIVRTILDLTRKLDG
jgi:pimeloyl-ACP methyl ester carboxylesterase